MATVRLDIETALILKQLASARGQTESDVIQDAISQLAEGELISCPVSALDRLHSFVGNADSGGRELATDSGRKFRELLVEKHRARDSARSNGLAHMAATWSDEDLAEFERAVDSFEEIDDDLWR